MDRTEEQKTDDTPVVSPLAKDRTYGERWYHSVFDWGFNYWLNALASAGFSQYAEHATRPIKLWGMKEAESPRALQQKLAAGIRDFKPDFLMQNFIKKMKGEAAAGIKTEAQATEAIMERSMARARSLTLLMPGFVVVIPAVWLGAKIKPWLVETLDRRHYGDDAMTDPTLMARHQAIAAEARPTLLGTVVARLGTMFAVQATAQLVGSRNNFVNKLGEKYNKESLRTFGIDPLTESVGTSIANGLPQKAQEGFNRFASKGLGFDHSEAQIKKQAEALNLNLSQPGARDNVLAKMGSYNTASQDLARFVAADAVYTMVTAMTIQPFVKLLRHVPFMSYKPKVKAGGAVFDENNRIKVPPNHYTDTAPRDDSPTSGEAASLSRSETDATPSARVSHVRDHIAPSTAHEELATVR